MLVLLLLLSVLESLCWASVGDQTYFYQKCLSECSNSCDNKNILMHQPLHMQFLGWNCIEECKYECMWKTVEVFKKSNLSIPQFYGKWPFLRLAGIQEPASVLFSILNGVTVWIGFKRFYAEVPRSAPMYNLVVFQFFLAENAWFWSVVYHCRDLPLTEKMDYFCATSIVLCSLYVCIYRYAIELPHKSRKYVCWITFHVVVIVYFGHISYLSFVKFDYGYNMLFNVICGLSSCFLAILFWIFRRHTLHYAWKFPVVGILSCILLVFEVFDFPPWLWMVDAHSIWHLSTVPLPLLLYSFVVDDQLHLVNLY